MREVITEMSLLTGIAVGGAEVGIVKEDAVVGMAVEGVVVGMTLEGVVLGIAVGGDGGDDSGGGNGWNDSGNNFEAISMLNAHGNRCWIMKLDGIHADTLLHTHGWYLRPTSQHVLRFYNVWVSFI